MAVFGKYPFNLPPDEATGDGEPVVPDPIGTQSLFHVPSALNVVLQTVDPLFPIPVHRYFWSAGSHVSVGCVENPPVIGVHAEQLDVPVQVIAQIVLSLWRTTVRFVCAKTIDTITIIPIPIIIPSAIFFIFVVLLSPEIAHNYREKRSLNPHWQLELRGL
jgi:hypothetical protein